MSTGIALRDFGLPMITSSTSLRSVRTFASASSNGASPFIGTSELVVVINRPRTRSTSGSGRKIFGSTPTGTIWSRSADTFICATMSRLLDCDTVTSRGICRATRICMLRNPYQRPSTKRRYALVACVSSRSRSTVIGWWSVQSTGQLSSFIIVRSPVPRHWLSCTMSKSARRSWSSRRARRLNAYGSGKPAPHMIPNSRRSIVDLISHGHGGQNGCGSA